MAMGSQGNGLISRGIIYQVAKELKTRDSKDMLVGIMWSGVDRHDFYNSTVEFSDNVDGWIENPTGFVNALKNWVILNWHWKNKYAMNYYGMFHDQIGAYIYTYEHILRTQWFLEANKVPYFMATYTNEVLPDFVKTLPEIKHLADLLDESKFLPIEGEYEWCRDFSELDFPISCDNHPSSSQHKKFVDAIIVPFLTQKELV